MRAAESVSDLPPAVVVGYGREQVQAALGERAVYAAQEEQLGTGHAVMQAADALRGKADRVIVLYGDMPLVRSETLADLVALFEESAATDPTRPLAASMITIHRDDPQGFGRIVRNEAGDVLRIVEEADCTPAQKRIRELNTGIYCFDAAWLWDNLDKIQVSAKGEYYLTDMVEIAVDQGRRVVTVDVVAEEAYGVNTRSHLAIAAKVLRRRILERHMDAGVTVIDPDATYVADTVTIGVDTVLLPGTHLQGETQIGPNCQIGPDTQIVDSRIGAGCRITYSVVEQARMDDGSEIGPFGHLRKGAHLGEGVHMGNFGEVKNSYLGPGTKMGHFSYLGDAQIEGDVNIGAGTITCNYDGKNKHKTIIGKGVFIGSDTMLVAPLELGENARTGAGSVVTKDVPAGGLVYGVPARQPKSHASKDS
jgi:bifunctional UDP-N-acetylglucosamine pyrophosphorylase/glucosamine-1-phosphate N-acetyltransferase